MTKKELANLKNATKATLRGLKEELNEVNNYFTKSLNIQKRSKTIYAYITLILAGLGIITLNIPLIITTGTLFLIKIIIYKVSISKIDNLAYITNQTYSMNLKLLEERIEGFELYKDFLNEKNITNENLSKIINSLYGVIPQEALGPIAKAMSNLKNREIIKDKKNPKDQLIIAFENFYATLCDIRDILNPDERTEFENAINSCDNFRKNHINSFSDEEIIYMIIYFENINNQYQQYLKLGQDLKEGFTLGINRTNTPSFIDKTF